MRRNGRSAGGGIPLEGCLRQMGRVTPTNLNHSADRKKQATLMHIEVEKEAQSGSAT